MATPHYIVKRIGDNYVPVPVQPTNSRSSDGWTFGGAALLLYGFVRGGVRGLIYMACGGAMTYRGITGINPLCYVFTCSKCKDSPDGDPSQTPSYQHDFK